jgi:hypothetical protein
MARLSPLFLAFLLGTASAVGLVSCGGGSDAQLLPGTTADQIESNLDQIAELAAAEDCVGAEDSVAEVTAEVEELQGVDVKLKTALQEGTAKLSEVVARCEEETTEEETEPALETDVEAEEVENEEKLKRKKKKQRKRKKNQRPRRGTTCRRNHRDKAKKKVKAAKNPSNPKPKKPHPPAG